jgi:DNA-binding NarL/FixJ family response regulator
MSGELYIPACALRHDHGHAVLAPERLAPRMPDAAGGLTPRQSEIMFMLVEGKSNKEIAREIKVLEGTVKLHVRVILHKLGVRNRTEAVLAAARSGYLPKGLQRTTVDAQALALKPPLLGAGTMTSAGSVIEEAASPAGDC